MTTCARCKQKIGMLNGLLGFNKKTGRCSKCEKIVKKELDFFRQMFLSYCNDGVLSKQEWENLQNGATHAGLDWSEALDFITGDALHFLERTLAFASADNNITPDEERYFHALRQQLNLSDTLTRPLCERMEYLKKLTLIRQGQLPVVKPGIIMQADELCHLESSAEFQKVTSKGVQSIQGKLLATNKKLHFLSEKGGWTIAWKNVMNVDANTQSVYIELSTKTGNGRYFVSDPVLTESILNTMTLIAKRQMLVPKNPKGSRHIPHDVKLSVWQRDRGCCVQCGAKSYLEFDHIIPFGKGGASTVNNVQLLCRKCNLSKGDRL